MVVPFVLALLAAVWDLRQFIAYRTDLAREMYVLAQAVADDAVGGTGGQGALRGGDGGGRAALRSPEHGGRHPRRRRGSRPGSRRRHDVPRWRVVPADGAGRLARDRHESRGHMAGRAGQPVHADRGATRSRPRATISRPGSACCRTRARRERGANAALAEKDWVSRNIGPQAWWVVVETCVEPPPGLFVGRLTGLSAPLLGTPYVWRRRAAWPSIHSRADCAWCASVPSG